MNLLDTSAIFSLFQSGKYSVLFSGATIPLAWYESGNVLWKNYKIKKRISKEEAMEFGRVLFELLDSMENVFPSPNFTLSLSMELGLTFYDSSYLSSAIETGYDLVTDDEKLYNIAKTKVLVKKSTDLR
jgi:predicted nucleic acid-binding protein